MTKFEFAQLAKAVIQAAPLEINRRVSHDGEISFVASKPEWKGMARLFRTGTVRQNPYESSIVSVRFTGWGCPSEARVGTVEEGEALARAWVEATQA